MPQIGVGPGSRAELGSGPFDDEDETVEAEEVGAAVDDTVLDVVAAALADDVAGTLEDEA